MITTGNVDVDLVLFILCMVAFGIVSTLVDDRRPRT